MLNEVFGEELLPGGGGSENDEFRESLPPSEGRACCPRDMLDMDVFMPPKLEPDCVDVWLE